LPDALTYTNSVSKTHDPIEKAIIEAKKKFIIMLSNSQIMNFSVFAFIAATVLIFASVYASTSSIQVFGKASHTVTDIECHPQGNGKTRCCGTVVNNDLPTYEGITYCTTCDDTNPPSHCTPREKVERTGIVKPGTDVLNALKGSKGLDVKSPSLTMDNTKVPKNFTSKGSELLKDNAKIEGSNNNPPPIDSNGTLQ
jgi:hypothetical protein